MLKQYLAIREGKGRGGSFGAQEANSSGGTGGGISTRDENTAMSEPPFKFESLSKGMQGLGA